MIKYICDKCMKEIPYEPYKFDYGQGTADLCMDCRNEIEAQCMKWLKIKRRK